MNKTRFTIFIPTHNRAYTLSRAFGSIEAQTCRDFEVVIVDDGSSDGTSELVEGWCENVSFPVQYIYQENQGKNVAHNTMLKKANGEYVVLLDSDDMLKPTALARFDDVLNGIPVNQREQFVGVEGLCVYLPDHHIAGKPFPEDVLDATHVEMRIKWRVKGEKRSAIRTDVLRRFLYPVFSGERHLRPSLLWDRLSEAGYLFRFFNEVVQVMEHQPDGLSANRFRMRMANPQGLRLCICEEIRIHGPFLTMRQRKRLCSRYARYSFHVGIGLFQQWNEVSDKGLWVLGLPVAVLGWAGDHLRKILYRNTNK